MLSRLLGSRLEDRLPGSSWLPNQGKALLPPARQEAPQVSRYGPGMVDHEILEKHRASHPQALLPASRQGNRPRLHDRLAIPELGPARGQRGLSLRRHQLMRHPCQARHHHTEGHSVGQKDHGLARLNSQRNLFFQNLNQPVIKFCRFITRT